MNVEYYNVINQFPLVNDWCIAVKLHKYYIKTDPELIDNINLANLYISYGFKHWNNGMSSSARNNHILLVKFFIEKGANSWNSGMTNAALNNHILLIKLFIEKGANEWNEGMRNAAINNHFDLIKFFIEKGASNYQHCYDITSSQEIKDYLQQFL
jgi:hypothetical protein